MNIIFYILVFIILFRLHNKYIYYFVFLLFIGNIIYEIFEPNFSKFYDYLFGDLKNQSVDKNLDNNESNEKTLSEINSDTDYKNNIKLTAKNINSLIKDKYTI